MPKIGIKPNFFCKKTPIFFLLLFVEWSIAQDMKVLQNKIAKKKRFEMSFVLQSSVPACSVCPKFTS
jgi:hypothetical protein